MRVPGTLSQVAQQTTLTITKTTISVVGLGAQYETAYEVCPRKAEDLAKTK